MSETELITKLAAAVAGQLRPAIPLNIDLWDVSTIAQLLKRSDAQVRERIVCLPDFPKAIRLPSEKGSGRPLWKAVEVLAWAEQYREKKTQRA
jgi:hypothetical protein